MADYLPDEPAAPPLSKDAMTVDDIKSRVAEIADLTDEGEEAHKEQDRLYVDLLRAIADDSCADPAACAREALAVEDLDFSRWYS